MAKQPHIKGFVPMTAKEMAQQRAMMTAAVLTGICSTPMVGEAATEMFGPTKLADFAVTIADAAMRRLSTPDAITKEKEDA